MTKFNLKNLLKNKYLIVFFMALIIVILMLFVDIRGTFSFLGSKEMPAQDLGEINGEPLNFNNCFDCPSGYKDYGWPLIMRMTNISGQTGSLEVVNKPYNIVLDFIIVYLIVLIIYNIARIIHLKSIKSITNKYAQNKNSTKS